MGALRRGHYGGTKERALWGHCEEGTMGALRRGHYGGTVKRALWGH